MKKIFILLVLFIFPTIVSANSFNRLCVYEGDGVVYKIDYTQNINGKTSTYLYRNGSLVNGELNNTTFDLRNSCPSEAYVKLFDNNSGVRYFVYSSQMKNTTKYTLNKSASTNPDVKASDVLNQQKQDAEDKKLVIECPYTIGSDKYLVRENGSNEFEVYRNNVKINFYMKPAVKNDIMKNGCPDNLYFKNTGNGNSTYMTISNESFNGATKGSLKSSEVREGSYSGNFSNNIPPKEYNFCEQNGVKLTFRVIGLVIFVAKILVPLLIIVFGILDFYKALISSDEKNTKEAFYIFAKRIIAGIIVFFIPTIINIIVTLIDGADGVKSKASQCQDCLVHPINKDKCSVENLGNN